MINNVTVIIPTYNSAHNLDKTLNNVSKIFSNIIVVDANSYDKTIKIAEKYNSKILMSTPNRGMQLNIGATSSLTEWILFLHSDSILARNANIEINKFIDLHPCKAGYFKLKFDDKSIYAIFLEKIVYLRNVLFKLPYGDQGLLISNKLYNKIGGFDPMPIMEDVNIISKLGYKNIKNINTYIVTDARKYKTKGWIKRSLFNFYCLILYILKTDINKIYKKYYNDK